MLWSRVRTFPHPRQRYLPLPGLSPDVYDMKRERGGGPIKVGCVGTESVGESADGPPGLLRIFFGGVGCPRLRRSGPMIKEGSRCVAIRARENGGSSLF